MVINETLKNFIKEREDLIQEGNWVRFFEDASIKLNSNHREYKLAYIMRESGIYIPIEDVFDSVFKYTDYIEDNQCINLSFSLVDKIRQSLKLDYSKELEKYSFKETVKTLQKFYLYDNDYELTDTSTILEFKFILNLNSIRDKVNYYIYVQSWDNTYFTSRPIELGVNFIDFKPGFGVAYNKDKLNSLMEYNVKNLLKELNK